jgi:hypothetical protein
MSNATLTITATLTNGAATRAIELAQLQHATQLALQQVRAGGGQSTSGSPTTGEYGSVLSASFTYSPVAAA